MPPSDEEIAALEKQLDPAARVVVSMMRQALGAMTSEMSELRIELQRVRAHNDELRRMLFGARSEKLPPIATEVRRAVDAKELGLDVSADDEASAGSSEAPADTETARRKRGRKRSEKKRKERRTRRNKLPVLHERVDVTAEQIPDGYTLSDFREVGDREVIRRVEHVREHLVVVEYVMQKLASTDGAHIVSAETPTAVVDGGHYGPGVYAHCIVSKCADCLPLYRIAKIFERHGCPIARSTLCSIFHRSASLLSPIYARLIDIAKADIYVNADETRMPVQHQVKCRDAWVWTMLSKDVIGYIFSATRKSDDAREMLAGTEGYLQVDGYAAYDCVCGDDKRTRVGCWAHTRRMFFKAMAASPEAREILDMIVELYMVEHTAANQEVLGTDAHLELRREFSVPIIERIERWRKDNADQHPPKSPIGEALTYLGNQWDTLVVFLQDPKLRLDNNISENALRIHALGRKNFLFVGHDEAGHNLAVLQTIVATCRLHGVNPYDYIKDVLIRVQTHPNKRIDELLPMNYKPPDVSTMSRPSLSIEPSTDHR